MRLLIVEDNKRLAALIAGALTDQAFVVDSMPTAEMAEAALGTTDYDLVLLDLALPDGDGEDILRALRGRGKATPILVMTARADVVHRIRILDLGADDYLVKPFLIEELLARVRALLRRPAAIVGNLYQAGNVTLDAAGLSVSIGDKAVDLRRREFAVLQALMRNQGRLLPKQTLVDAVYSFDNEVTPNAVEAVVSRLRRRLEALGANVTITAMRGLGYILAPDGADASAR